jgi:hypothetical protein
MLHYTHITYFVIYGMELLLCVFASVYQELQWSCSWHWSCRMSKYVFLFLSLFHKVWGSVLLGKLSNHSAWQEIIIVWILRVAMFAGVHHWSVFWPGWIHCLSLHLFYECPLQYSPIYTCMFKVVSSLWVLDWSFVSFSLLTLSHAICFAYINLDIQWRVWLLKLLFLYFQFTSLLLNSEILSPLFSTFLSRCWHRFGVSA